MTVDEIAEIFKVQRETVRDWIAEGKFPNAIKLGRAWRIPRSDVVTLATEKHG